MRKLLSLMSLLAVSTTTVTSVVACSNDKQNLTFDFSKSVNTLSDGTINVLGKTIDSKVTTLPDGIVNDIKDAIVTRLQTGTVENTFGNLKASDFKLTIGLDLPIIPNAALIENDQVKDATGLLNVIKAGQTKVYDFVLTPNKGTAVFFKNTMTVRDYTATTVKALLAQHGHDNPVHLFTNPTKVTQANFKEVFWNAVLGEPGSFNKQKDNFDVKISDSELDKLNANNTDQAPIKVDFSIKNDFKTTQTGLSFKKGDKVAGAVINFQTKLPTFDFSKVKEVLQKDKFNFKVNKGTSVVTDAVTLVKTEILKQANILGLTTLTINDFKISIQGAASDLPLIPFVTNDVVNADEQIQAAFLTEILNNSNPEIS